MRVVIDGLPITGMSLAIVVEHLLEGWQGLAIPDDLHLVIGPDADLTIPSSVTVHRFELGNRPTVGRLRTQTLTLRKICRDVRADVLLGVLPTTAVSPLRCPRVVMAYDLRHELRPQQFSTRARLMRKASYGIGFRQADGVACISERTRQDLLRSRPWMTERIIRVAHLGADHVDTWPSGRAGPEYALAFGQYGNKNVDLVIDAWSQLAERGESLHLALVGLSDSAREMVQAKVRRLGLGSMVTALPWLPITAFRERFGSAALVVFPSDFEGFGLPVIEAMRLGIPVVITPEPALLEVSGGHATVMDGWGPDALADAVKAARRVSANDIDAARSHANGFTWARTAASVRSALAEVVGRQRGRSPQAG